jgi:hypothetical protein
MSQEPADVGKLAPGLERLAELARTSFGHMTPEQCLRGERAVVRRMAVRGRSGWVVGGLAAAVLASAFAAVVVTRHGMEPRPLGYLVENGRLEPGQELVAAGGVSPLLRFSDGTEIRLGQGAHARIRAVTSRGAALAVERGELSADVVHTAVSEWQFNAGPFVVRVTGTAFKLDFEPEEDRFDLRLEHGAVTVTAPIANDPIPLRAGQWLTIRARTHEVLIRDLLLPVVDAGGLGPEGADGWAPQSDEPTPRGEPGTPSVTPPPASDAPRPAWAKQLAGGKFDAIVKDALGRGLESSLAESNSEDLSALADAARYTRRHDIARKALVTLRRRFPGSRPAQDAAFLLGRLAEAEQNESGALGFFETYLGETPGGTYAPEALGRKLAIVQHTRGSASARPIAADYLAKYPNGTYASAARAILEKP